MGCRDMAVKYTGPDRGGRAVSLGTTPSATVDCGTSRGLVTAAMREHPLTRDAGYQAGQLQHRMASIAAGPRIARAPA